MRDQRGEVLYTKHDLPKPRSFTHWTQSRKRLFVAAVRHHLISRADFLSRYEVSEEEFETWENAPNAKVYALHSRPGQPMKISIGRSYVWLPGMEYAVFSLLLEHKNRTVPRREILLRLFGEDTERTRRCLIVHMCRLRQKLAFGKQKEIFIESVWGRGYKIHDPKNRVHISLPIAA